MVPTTTDLASLVPGKWVNLLAIVRGYKYSVVGREGYALLEVFLADNTTDATVPLKFWRDAADRCDMR